MVADDLRHDDLIEVLPEYKSAELGIYAVYQSRKHLAPKVRVFISFLSERFAARQWVKK